MYVKLLKKLKALILRYKLQIFRSKSQLKCTNIRRLFEKLTSIFSTNGDKNSAVSAVSAK